MLKFIFLFTSAVFFTLNFSVANKNEQKTAPRNAAIIGGGIAGTSASFFLREKFGNDLKIDLYEPTSKLCGRVATVNIGGREYECGASIMHPRNLYVKGFVETFPDLEEASRYKGTIGFFDGAGYLVRTSRWMIIGLIKLLWTFGFDLLRLHWLESNFLNKFGKIYELQDQGESYDDVDSLLYAMGGEEFNNATQMTSYEFFSRYGISDFTIKNLITPGISVNYGQNASANGFVGAVAMAGVQPGLWSVKGGNRLICDRLAKKSSANIIHEHVTNVTFDPEKENGQFSLFTQESTGNIRSYDIVILTTPVGPGMSDIDITAAVTDAESCPTVKVKEGKEPMEYRRTVANFVRGKLRSSLFQCDSIEDCPSAILVTNQDIFYRSVGLHMPVDYNPDVDTLDSAVYKVFSTTPLTEEQLSYLFESYSETKVVDWKAYPYYRFPGGLSSMVLNKAGLYYTSPIEWAASAIEMSIISAKNAVLLSYNNWYGLEDKMNLHLNLNKGDYDITRDDNVKMEL